ncbi:MAG: PP2C family protein-serine/threonine phosphatase [Desulfobacterales bacterium]|nr:PP2C family protein-serine/threonine phosphatase [Desulfobacterales bacterium]
MTRLTLLRLKIQMFFFNLVANGIGVVIVVFFTFGSIFPPPPEVIRISGRVAGFFEPAGLFLLIAATLIYERPIHRLLDRMHRGKPIPPDIELKARQRLLNEPFFLIAVDAVLWLGAAFVYPACYWSVGVPGFVVWRVFFQSVMIGLVSITAAFFVLEHVLQKLIAPRFFPHGGLYATPGAIRVRIRGRLVALMFACNLIPLLTFLIFLQLMRRSGLEPGEVLELLERSIITNTLLGVFTGVSLTILVAGVLTRPLEEIIRVLKGVHRGDFDQKVRVATNDEIGYTGDVINEMTDGLKERDRMRQSLDLAREVQRSLLPRRDPRVEGLDIAGTSVYCDRTGGDYYDYLTMGRRDSTKISVIVGDVSGHGVPSALLMAAARALIHKCASLSDNIATIVSDVNRHLSRDVEESGGFMTLFFSEIDAKNKRIRWTRAGHDPAIFYDPAADAFEELKGPGVALGLDEEWAYEEREKSGLSAGQIIVFYTDGVWEARGADGGMFGKESIRAIIRREKNGSAARILNAIVEALNRFQGDRISEDDVTLVVVKIGDGSTDLPS